MNNLYLIIVQVSTMMKYYIYTYLHVYVSQKKEQSISEFKNNKRYNDYKRYGLWFKIISNLCVG